MGTTSPSGPTSLSSVPLKAINVPVHLAGNPKSLRYSTTIKDRTGKTITLADPRATRALLSIMNLTAVNGGAACHWGGPSALAEAMSALHALMFRENPWHESYHFVNDVGHAENGIYALRANYGFDGLSIEDLWKFRSIDSKLTGHGESHVNPEGVLLSNGPLGSAFPQAQGLAVADKLLGKKRTTICVVSDGAAMEGEAKEAMSAIPGLFAKGKLNPFLMILSDNNTKLSGRIDEDSFSMGPSFQALKQLGWKVIPVENGHDLEKVYQVMEESLDELKNHPQAPICLWLKTIKGYGIKSTAQSSSGGHGFPLKKNDPGLIPFIQEIYSDAAPSDILKFGQLLLDQAPKVTSDKPASSAAQPSVKKEKAQAGFSKALIEAVEKGFPVFSVTSDLGGSTGIGAFQKAYPDRTLDVGVAESNMVSTAAGLSKMGLIPVVDTFAQFGVTKGNLPLTMAALSQAPVIAAFSHTGFQDAADGASHQATTYFAAISAIPDTLAIAVSTSGEAYQLMQEGVARFQAQQQKGHGGESLIFFVGREDYPANLQDMISSPIAPLKWGKAQLLTQGNAATIVSCGPMIHEALKAYELLKAQGIEVSVINHPFVNRPDVELLKATLAKTGGKLLTLEDHQKVGGLGSLVVHALAQANVAMQVKSLGIENHFGRSAYTSAQLYSHWHLDAQSVVKAIKEWK